jgi:hypothetical protein
MTRRRGRLAAVIVALVVTGATGCGIPIDDSPEPVELPPQYRTATTTEPPPTVAASGALTAMLCLTRDQRLVEVERPVETAPSPEELLTNLIDGPTNAETRDQQLTSALTGITAITLVGIDQGVAEVTIGDSLDGITGDNRLLIYGQIVCTLYGHPAVTGIQFSRDGQPLPVPRGNATVTTDVLTTDDYANLLEPS